MMENASRVCLGTPFEGLWYNDVIWKLSRLRSTSVYLEIGVRNGGLFKGVSCDIAIGIDPRFEINCNISENKREVRLIQDTSDNFFKKLDKGDMRISQPDFVFLDGMHLFEFLLRDFINVESICSKGALIAIHDCLPLDDIMINRDENFAVLNKNASKFPGWWTGDLWKFIIVLKKYRPDLRLIFADAPPTGLMFVSCLDASSKILSDNYFRIIDEFIAVPNTTEELSRLYSDITLTKGSSIVQSSSHSIYFAT